MKIAVDLDGTLAEYHGWQGPTHIGKPIPLMLERVKQWLRAGHKVVIFTARISLSGSEHHIDWSAIDAIFAWLKENGIPEVTDITNVKQKDFDVFYDDRCIQVEPNTGQLTLDVALTALQHAP